MRKPEEIIEDLDKNFNEEEFNELDRAFGDFIKEGTYDNELYFRTEKYIQEVKKAEIELFEKFGGQEPSEFEYLGKMKNEETVLEKSLMPFIKMCENHEIDFSKTCVFKELARRFKDTDEAKVFEKWGIDLKI